MGGPSQAVERVSSLMQSAELYEHQARYLWASRWSYGKLVLDVACGSGLGFEHLVPAASAVVGCDVSAEALHEARRSQYPAILVQATGSQLPLGSNKVEVVMSFETIEHLEDPRGFLSEVSRVLKPEGVLLLSTPNGLFSKRDALGRLVNPFHIQEFTSVELRGLLKEHFDDVQLLGQRVAPDFGICPYWDTAAKPTSFGGWMRVVLWKLLGRLPFGEHLTELVLRQPRFPTASDWVFSPQYLSEAHVLVAHAIPRSSQRSADQ